MLASTDLHQYLLYSTCNHILIFARAIIHETKIVVQEMTFILNKIRWTPVSIILQTLHSSINQKFFF